MPSEDIVTDNLDLLLDALPPRVAAPLRSGSGSDALLEVVMDLGRLPEARYPDREVQLGDEEITDDDIDYVVTRIGDFGDDNRAGIERTLHRISCIRNRRGKIVGLTCRIGRAVYGTIRVIEDLVRTDRSLLLLGRPGVGKTTMLREVARVLADDANRRVVIVDTSNEIGGDGDIPHPSIGTSRRMQVATPALQHAVMIEAVENHMPQVVVIDEIGTELEAAAARTIAERGVQLVGTAHGNTLENLMMNPTLSDLIGGIQSVTLGDEEARRRGTQKSILERKAPPTFDIIVEIESWSSVRVIADVASTVDAMLRGYPVKPESRRIGDDGGIDILERGYQPPPAPTRDENPGRRPGRERAAAEAYDALPEAPGAGFRIFPFGISRNRLEQAARNLRMRVDLVRSLDEAEAVITMRAYYRQKPDVIREAEDRRIPIFVMKANTLNQIEQVLNQMQAGATRRDPMADMFKETEEAIHSVLEEGQPVDLSPQNGYIRRLQHELASRYNVPSKSSGRDPNRRVRLLPSDAVPGLEFPESQ